jgi:hypothetical protein
MRPPEIEVTPEAVLIRNNRRVAAAVVTHSKYAESFSVRMSVGATSCHDPVESTRLGSNHIGEQDFPPL